MHALARPCLFTLLLCAPAAAQDGGAAPQKGVASSLPPIEQRIRPAIENGLVWLCRHQDAGGGWRAATLATHCDAGSSCVSAEVGGLWDTGLTGLSILALLGAGASPRTPYVLHGANAEITYDTWACVDRAVKWLISVQEKNGSVSGQGGLYSDAIAAIALSEAFRVSRHWPCREAAQKALDFVVAGQADGPGGKSTWGWRYVPKDPESDTSVTGWAVRALEAGERAGIRPPKSSVAGAHAFIEWVTGKSGGLVGYMQADQAGMKVEGPHDTFDYHVGTMSALGIQVKLRTQPKPDKATSAWLKTAVNEVLIRDLPSAGTSLGIDYYYWHQAADAWAVLEAHGFDELAESGAPWRRALVEALASLQSAPSEKCSSGGWLTLDRWAHEAGPIYSTAINVLSLESVEPLFRH